MKLFGKLFITMMCVTILSYMIFGNILVQTAFRTTLNREIERSIEEMKIFQYALVASLEGLPKDYQATDIAVGGIAESIQQNLNSSQSTVVIYNKKREIIYQNTDEQSNLIQQEKNISSGAWQITKHKDKYCLESLCKTDEDTDSYILEIHRTIDHIYQDRDRLYDRYFLTLILISGAVAVVLFLISIHFTRPIRKLSQATRAFADGDYQSRVKEKGYDEVAVLSQDFNRMATQLEDSIHQLKETARQQEEFTEAFSHELKTPLTSIVGYADLLRSMNLSEEDSILSADYIFHQGKRLERLAKKMMELSYIDKQKITVQKIDVASFAHKIKSMTEKLLEPKGLLLILQIEEGFFYGDSDLLLSLFSNLIDNARKASRPNGTIVLEGRCNQEGYCFCLRDNGRGMPEKEIQKITEPFYMIDKSRARKEGSAGIGMALCQKIITLHQAEWTIQSQINAGTQIQIQFTNHLRTEGADAQ